MSTTAFSPATTALPTALPAAVTGPRAGTVVRRILLALAPLLAVVLAAAPAEAYTTTARSGVPVTPVVYAVQGSHYATGSAVTGPMYKPWLYQSGPVVYRTGGTAQQQVRVVYRVDRWNGSSWVLRHTATGSTSIAAGTTSATAPNLSLLPADGSGYYRVRVELTWTSAVGAHLGQMHLTMNGSADYRCSTTRTCTSSPSWVYLGA